MDSSEDGTEKTDYLFISGADRSYAGKVRAHVLRGYMSHRRRHAKTFKSAGSTPKPLRESAECLDAGMSVSLPMRPWPPLRPPTPIMPLGQGRVDPFQTLAKPTTYKEDLCIDHYVNVLIPRYYSMGSNTRYNLHRQLFFSVCMEDPAAINAVIFTALQHLGLTNLSFVNAALFYKSKLLQIVHDRFSDPIQRLSPSTMYCVAVLLTTTRGLSVRTKSPAANIELQAHLQGFRKLICLQGGLEKLAKRPALLWNIAWLDTFLFGEISAGMTPLSMHAVDSSAGCSPSQSLTYPAANDFLSYAKELVGAYTNFYQEAQKRLHASRKGSSHSPRTKPIFRFFEKGSLFHRYIMMASTPGLSINSVALTIYLNIILWDYRHTPAATLNLYFERLHALMAQEGLNKYGSKDSFLCVFVVDPVTQAIERPEMMWLLNRMLRIQNRLGLPLRQRLEEMFLRFLLAGSDECDGLPWDPDRFRLDVYQDLGLGEYANSCIRRPSVLMTD